MTVLGIDPGLEGGLALIGHNTVIVEPIPIISDTELDMKELESWLRHQNDFHQITRAFLEMPGIRPFQPPQSTLKVGRISGQIEMGLVMLGISYQFVAPAKWSKVMHDGITEIKNAKGKRDTKKMSKLAVARLFPSVDLIAPGCKTIHMGMMDALLIAEWGRRSMQGAA